MTAPGLTTAPEPFDVEIKTVVLGLRQELGALLAGEIAPPFQPIEIHKRFGVDRRLGWTVSRLLQDEDLYTAALHYPGSAAIKRFARKVGAGDEESARLAEAARSFEEVVSRHAGDRETFESLVAANAGDETSRSKAIEQRRVAFGANASIYGVRARVQTATYFLSPNPDGTTVDVAVIRGFVGMQRLTPDRSWPIMARHWASEDGTPATHARFRPLDPSVSPDASLAPLLPDFCEPASMRIEAEELPSGIREYRLPPAGVGLAQAQVCMIGERIEQAGSRFATETDPVVALSPAVRTPVEALLIDCLVHEDLAGLGTPTLSLTSDVNRLAGGPPQVLERDHLDPLTEAHRLGVASEAAVREHRIERYGPMITAAFGMLGAERERFALHRAWLPHPPISSTATFTFALPAPPASASS